MGSSAGKPDTRLSVAFAMFPGLESSLFRPTTLAQLNVVADLVSGDALDLATAPVEVLAGIDVLIGGWGSARLDLELLDRLPELKLFAYAAGSVRGTVTDALWDRGIQVSSAASANARPVAELTFAAVVMIAKDVWRVRDRYRETRGQQYVAGSGPAGEVGTNGLRVGVVGASKIGRLVIERLHTLDVELAVFDPYLDDPGAGALGAERVPLDRLCAWADIVTLHAPELASTRHLIGRDQLAAMRDGAWLLNTARGSLVDTSALEAECSSGRLCAFIDTPDPEPLPPTSPLWDLQNVVLTPHIAGSLGNEVARMGELATKEVVRFARGLPLQHPVLREDMDRIA